MPTDTEAVHSTEEIKAARKEVAEAKEALASAQAEADTLNDAARHAESFVANAEAAAHQAGATDDVKKKAEDAVQAAEKARKDADAAQKTVEQASDALAGAHAKVSALEEARIKAAAEQQSPFSRWAVKHWWQLLVYSVVGVYILINTAFVVVEFWDDGKLLRTMLAGVFFKLLLLLALIWFVEFFTKPLLKLEDQPPGPSGTAVTPEERQKNWDEYIRLKQRWMIFAYGFMIFAIFAAVYPYMLDFVPDPDNGERSKQRYKQYVAEKLDAPIGIFRGCVGDKNGEPEELRCYAEGEEENVTAQRLSWIIHIGGAVQSFDPEAGRDKVAEQAKQVPVDAEAARRKAEEIPETLMTGQAKVHMLPGVAKPPERLATDADAAAQPLAPSDVPQSTSGENSNAAVAHGNAGFMVSGGLVVPLYLIILALIGGAISLTRRVPEHQKQAAPSYVPTEQAPKLTPAMLREYLVFQIVQFISAPFLAIVAYYLIAPGNPAATVAIAFIAGFASETVLLMVRAVVDKVEPITAKPARTGSVVGTVFSTPNEVPVQGAQVRVVGIQGGETETDAEGRFVLNGVTAGEHAVEVSKDEKQTFAAVKIESERATLAPKLRLNLGP